MKRQAKSDRTEEVSVLVTVDEPHRKSLDVVAKRLSRVGLKVVDKLALGGVITGDIAITDLESLRRVKGVAHVEKDQSLTTGSKP